MYDIGIFGGAGNDIFNFNNGEADDGTATPGPFAALLDGGLGNDVLNFGGCYTFNFLT